MPNQIDVKKLLPGLIIGILFLGFFANGLRNWLFDMMDSSYRTSGQYAKLMVVPAPPVVLPKDTYLCDTPQKTPWLGCAIR